MDIKGQYLVILHISKIHSNSMFIFCLLAKIKREIARLIHETGRLRTGLSVIESSTHQKINIFMFVIKFREEGKKLAVVSVIAE